MLTGRQRLLELVCLVVVLHAQRVQELGAADLELGHRPRLLDLNRLGVGSARGQKELFDFHDLARLCDKQKNLKKGLSSVLRAAAAKAQQKADTEEEGLEEDLRALVQVASDWMPCPRDGQNVFSCVQPSRHRAAQLATHAHQVHIAESAGWPAGISRPGPNTAILCMNGQSWRPQQTP